MSFKNNGMKTTISFSVLFSEKDKASKGLAPVYVRINEKLLQYRVVC